MVEWEGTKYGLLPNMAGKHELEKIKLREEIVRLKGQAEAIANVTHCSKPECIEVARAYLEQDAEITRLKEETYDGKIELTARDCRNIRNDALEEAAKVAEDFAYGWPITSAQLGNKVRQLKTKE